MSRPRCGYSAKPASTTSTKKGYGYGIWGNRRIVKTSDGGTSHYLYDGDAIDAEWNGTLAGTPAAVYAHGAGVDEPLLRLSGATTTPDALQTIYLQGGLGSVNGQLN